MSIKTSLLLSYKYRFYGLIISLVSIGLILVESFLLKQKIGESYFLYTLVLGFFFSAISREKKETNRTTVNRYRALKVFFIISIPSLLASQLIIQITKFKIEINLVYICLAATILLNIIYLYYSFKGKKKEDDDL